MPERVQKWKDSTEKARLNYESYFENTVQAMGGTDAAKIRCKKLVDDMAKKATSLIDIKFGCWDKVPLALAAMLNPDEARGVATMLYRKHGESEPAGVPKKVWEAINSWRNKEKGDEMEEYKFKLGPQEIDLATYLQGRYLPVCIHNVDPERYGALSHEQSQTMSALL